MCRLRAPEMLLVRPQPMRPMRMRVRCRAWRLAPARHWPRSGPLAPALVALPVRALVLVRPMLRLLDRAPVQPMLRRLALALVRPMLPVLALVRVRPMLPVLAPALVRVPRMLLVRALVRVLALVRAVLAAAVDRRGSILAPIIRTWRRTLDRSTGILLRSCGSPSSAAR